VTVEGVELVVVGSGPAGIETVRAYREHGGQGRVLMVTADPHPPYDRPPLTKAFLRGELEEDGLAMEDEEFYRSTGLELLLGRTVTGLDTGARRLRLDDGSSLAYATCVLTTGSRPVPLPVEGGDHPAVHLLRSRADAVRLRSAAADVRDVVVVGSGFIGCEAAASLAAPDRAVTVVSLEQAPQQQRLGGEAAAVLAGWLHDDGVRFVGGASITGVRDGRRVVLDDGDEIDAELVLVAAGVEQAQDWIHHAGLRCHEARIEVDSSMRTSDPHVLAAGDVAHAHNDAAGRHLSVEHWGDAVRMGEVAGATAAGAADRWSEPPGFWSDIGGRVLKHSAWGDGYDETRVVSHGDGAFTVWYGKEGAVVGVLTHEADDDYERGQRLVAEGARF
jgi:3-phenylpropionate/trans-cinnamate dioxygenase ferredoxin reductase subunit